MSYELIRPEYSAFYTVQPSSEEGGGGQKLQGEIGSLGTRWYVWGPRKKGCRVYIQV